MGYPTAAMDPIARFRKQFECLTGTEAFPWQENLYERFKRHEIPSVCTLPTGVCKTSVIALWLLALGDGARLSRRLVYVVNRRTVVDQTTAEVERLRKNLPSLQLASIDALSIRAKAPGLCSIAASRHIR